MTSSIALHRQRTRHASIKVQDSDPYYAKLYSKFKIDKGHLRTYRSTARRVKAKQQLVLTYQSWIVHVMQSGQCLYEDMYIWLLIWHLDIGELGYALDMAELALAQNMPMPIRFTGQAKASEFERNLPEILVEQIVDTLMKRSMGEQSILLLERVERLVEGCDMLDVIQAKLLKAKGLAYMLQDKQQAVQCFEQAVALYPRIGVKQLLRQLLQPQAKSKQKPKATPCFTLSATQAAKILGVSPPTIISHAKKHPQKLPHLAIPTGSRTLYRFDKNDVVNYQKQFLNKG